MWIRSCLAIVAIALAACVGVAPPGEDSPPDAAPAPAVDASLEQTPDGGVEESDASPVAPTTLDVVGTARDYWTGDALAAVDLATDGIDPRVTATSDAEGLFGLIDLPAVSAFYVRASRAAGYRVTVNEPVFVGDLSVEQDLYVVSAADASRQHTTAGLEVSADSGIVIANLLSADDTPLAGIVAASITLVDSAGEPVGAGPFFFGEFGDIDVALTETVAVDGRARVAFLNVPAGIATLTVVDDGDGSLELDVLVRPAGAHLLLLGGAGDRPPVPTAPRFGVDVYPLLQSAAAGGAGCGNCHRTGGPAQTFRFDDEVAAVYQAIVDRAGVVDLDAPAASSLLTAPLYEDPPDHPNATWLDETAADYQTILLWIQQGAAQ